MIFAVSIVLTAGVLAYVFLVRPEDLPAGEPPPPTAHLEERKAVIYDNLRDLNFEFGLGKLSEADYHRTKTALQNELAHVLAEIDRLAGQSPRAPRSSVPGPGQAGPAPKPRPEAAYLCPHCGAQFDKQMKYCGECGKPMTGVEA